MSTDKQDLSPAVQEQRIRAWAEMKGLGAPKVYIETQSGKSADDRPVLQAALAAVCEHRGVLVVVKLDRLSRSIKDAAEIAERLSESGADLVSLTEGLVDTTTANGELVFNFFCMIAQFERRQISERTTAVLDAKRARGEYLGNTPFGYARGADGLLVPHEAEHRALAFCLQQWGKYRSYAFCLRALNESEHRPRQLPWNAASVKRMLSARRAKLQAPDQARKDAAEAIRAAEQLPSDKKGLQAIAARLTAQGITPPDTRWSRASIRRLVKTYFAADETNEETTPETTPEKSGSALG